jgi:putative transposase
MQTKGLSERRGLQVVRMSASALRYQPRPDRNQALRERIVALAQRHRRYGVGMIHLKLRQARRAHQLQAGRAAVCAREAAYPAPAAQEDPGV